MASLNDEDGVSEPNHWSQVHHLAMFCMLLRYFELVLFSLPFHFSYLIGVAYSYAMLLLTDIVIYNDFEVF